MTELDVLVKYKIIIKVESIMTAINKNNINEIKSTLIDSIEMLGIENVGEIKDVFIEIDKVGD